MLTEIRNVNKLKSTCIYCSRPSDNPCYLESDDKQAKTCPLRTMEFRETHRSEKSVGTCFTCLSDSSGNNCQLSSDEFPTDGERNKYCTMRPLNQIYPIISSTQRKRIMKRIKKWDAFFMQHGDNIIFMAGINAEGCPGGKDSGSNAIIDIVAPINAPDDSIIEDDENDIESPRRGRKPKSEIKRLGREILMREGLLDTDTEGEKPKRGRGRPRKTENIGVAPKRGRPPKNENNTKKTDNPVVKQPKSVGSATSEALDALLGI